jgi:hypothetical protein
VAFKSHAERVHSIRYFTEEQFVKAGLWIIFAILSYLEAVLGLTLGKSMTDMKSQILQVAFV